jgi:uncharacterized OB-fold protein
MTNATPTTGLLPGELVSFTANAATEPFWAAAREHQLVVPRCVECGTFRFPPAAFCWTCRAQEVEWIEHDGAGDLYSFTIMRHAVIPNVAEALPLVIGVVELPDTNGCRVIGDVIGIEPEAVRIGMPLVLDWYDLDDGSVPCFRPRG